MLEKIIKPTACVLALSVLFGCAQPGPIIVETRKTVEAQVEKFPKPEESSNVRVLERRKEAYFGQKTIPISNEKFLPPVFSKPQEFKIVLVSGEGKVNLSTFAERITRLTELPVEIDQNVFVRQPQIGGQASNAVSGGTANGPSDRVANTAYDFEKNLTLDYEGPLAKCLDLAATRLGISWEYVDGRIHFYRYKSKTFEIKAIAGVKKINTNFSSSGSVQTSSSGNEASSGSNTIVGVTQQQEAKLGVWDSLINEIGAMLTVGGRLATNESAGTVTITDTPQTLRVIESFLEDQNRRISRSVFFKVDVLSVSKKRGNEGSLDLNGLLTNAAQKYRLITSPGKSLATDNTAGAGFFVLPPKVAGANPNLESPGFSGDAFKNSDGTSLFVKFLNEGADVAIKNRFNVSTVNNSPVPVSISSTQGYVESIGSVQSQTTTATTIQQKTVTTGTSMVLTPRLLDNNQILLQYTVELSELEGFDVTVTPSGSVKSPKVPRRVTSQTTKINAGQTIVLTGLSRSNANDAGNVGLGGSWNKSTADEDIVVLITPVLMGDGR